MHLVSVILLNYNNKKFINDSFSSILSQTFKDYEFIIIDDGSKDGSVEFLKELQQTYPFIKLHLQENQGVSKTLNYAIQNLATGKYIAGLASDDYWHEKNLEEKVKFMEEHPEYGMCFTDIYHVEKGKVFSQTDTSYFKSGWIFKEILTGEARVQGVSTLVKRSVYLDCGCYDTSLLAEDWDMYLRIANKYPIGYLPKKLVYYRHHENNSFKNYSVMDLSVRQALAKWETHPDYPKAIRNYDLSFLNLVATYQKHIALGEIIKYVKKYKTIPLAPVCRYIMPDYLFRKIKAFFYRLKDKKFF